MSLWNVEITDGVAVASYNNPPMNYMTADGMNELKELIEQWRDPDVRVVVLTGGLPDQFITHYSVEELVESARDKAMMMNIGRAWLHHHNNTLTNLEHLPKPVIAAMTGSTMGGGFETSLSCAIRIGQQGDYRYGLPEVTLGILPGGCGTQRLSRLIGAGRAIREGQTLRYPQNKVIKNKLFSAVVFAVQMKRCRWASSMRSLRTRKLVPSKLRMKWSAYRLLRLQRSTLSGRDKRLSHRSYYIVCGR